jgi:hypothetical protein
LRVPLKVQLKQSDGVIHGIFQGQTVRKLSDGSIVTENTFQILNKSASSQINIVNWDNFKILTPGGVWQGLVHHVQGTPRFRQGEEVILLLKKGKYGVEISGLGAGKYKLKKTGQQSVIYSTIFPYDKKLGNISLSDFNQVLQEAYGEPLHDGRDKASWASRKFTHMRGISSVNDDQSRRETKRLGQSKKDQSGFSLGGAFFLLLMFIAIVYFLNKK